MHARTIKEEEAINFKVSKKGFMGGLGGRKADKKINVIHNF